MSALLTEAQARDELSRLWVKLTKYQATELAAEVTHRARCAGWHGDPMRQPATVILGCWRSIQARQAPEHKQEVLL